MRAAVLSVALTACAYSPGSFSHFQQDFPGQRTTVGCIDLSVERRPDLTSGGTVLAYEFCSETMRTPAQVLGHLQGAGLGSDLCIELVAARLDNLCRQGLMVGEDGQYLSLALPANPNW